MSSNSYSTVTDCFRFDVLSDNNFGKDIDYNLDLSFKLIIRSSKLTKLYHYNTYQTKLQKWKVSLDPKYDYDLNQKNYI